MLRHAATRDLPECCAGTVAEREREHVSADSLFNCKRILGVADGETADAGRTLEHEIGALQKAYAAGESEYARVGRLAATRAGGVDPHRRDVERQPIADRARHDCTERRREIRL